jgi:hypothetical protein
MKSRTHLTIVGPFAVQDLGRGAWLLTGPAPAAPEIYLRFDNPPPAQFANASNATTLALVWGHDGADLTLGGASDAKRLEARTAIVHESKQHLYSKLPLADFDPNARRFWTRIFRVMRFPGGRYALRFLARLSR